MASGGFVVRAKTRPMPPVARTTARARCSTRAPSAWRTRTPATRPPSVTRSRAKERSKTERPLRPPSAAPMARTTSAPRRVARVQHAGPGVRGLTGEVEMAGGVAIETRAEREELRPGAPAPRSSGARSRPDRRAPHATASVSAAWSAGESPGPTAPATPPCAQGLLPVRPSGPFASRSTRRPRRPSATESPAAPAPSTTTSASRTASGRRFIGRLPVRPPASARPRGAPARPPQGRPRRGAPSPGARAGSSGA